MAYTSSPRIKMSWVNLAWKEPPYNTTFKLKVVMCLRENKVRIKSFLKSDKRTGLQESKTRILNYSGAEEISVESFIIKGKDLVQ